MKKNAAFRDSVNPRLRLVPIALSAVSALCLLALGGVASAAPPVGKDGKIHACYKVKGKPKGTLRVVPSARAHCRRGERKVAWSVATTSGVPAASGQQGSQGQQGANGTGGAGSDEAALKAQISALSLKVESLEGLLAGLTSGDLSGLLGRMNGLEGVLSGVDNDGLTHAVDAVKDVNGSDLVEAVDAAPLVEEVCAQTEALTGRSNALLSLLDTLDALNVLSLPATLPVFNVCPAP